MQSLPGGASRPRVSTVRSHGLLQQLHQPAPGLSHLPGAGQKPGGRRIPQEEAQQDGRHADGLAWHIEKERLFWPQEFDHTLKLTMDGINKHVYQWPDTI